jgi:hypothetical protein
MSIGTDTQAVVRAQIADRIDMIGREVAHLSTGRIALLVDDIRRDARSARLDTLAILASGLERAIATSAGAVVVLPWLEAMGDALDGEALPASAQASLLASVGVRLHG